VSDATVTELDAPDQTREASFLMVGRSHVRLIATTAE
jgi:hypothetical protein